MAKKAVKYCVVDAYTGTAFKGNPAAVCFFEEEEEEEERGDSWLQSVAAEFNISQTCFLTPTTNNNKASANPTFRLRWFTPVAEVKLCGHATLAAAHFLFTSGLVNTDIVEFLTLSGILSAKRVPHSKNSSSSNVESGEQQDGLSIELNFPLVKLTEYNFTENVSLPQTLSGASPVEILATENDVFVVLSSAKEVAELQPQFDEIQKLPGRGLIVTGLTPPGSEFDFYSRFFCPKLKINEDPVCGSAHCAIAPYWCQKLGKPDLVAYQASPRGGILNLHVDETNQRILLGGKAVTIMEGSIVV